MRTRRLRSLTAGISAPRYCHAIMVLAAYSSNPVSHANALTRARGQTSTHTKPCGESGSRNCSAINI